MTIEVNSVALITNLGCVLELMVLNNSIKYHQQNKTSYAISEYLKLVNYYVLMSDAELVKVVYILYKMKQEFDFHLLNLHKLLLITVYIISDKPMDFFQKLYGLNKLEIRHYKVKYSVLIHEYSNIDENAYKQFYADVNNHKSYLHKNCCGYLNLKS
jgi:hypothetical protein